MLYRHRNNRSTTHNQRLLICQRDLFVRLDRLCRWYQTRVADKRIYHRIAIRSPCNIGYGICAREDLDRVVAQRLRQRFVVTLVAYNNGIHLKGDSLLCEALPIAMGGQCRYLKSLSIFAHNIKRLLAY